MTGYWFLSDHFLEKATYSFGDSALWIPESDGGAELQAHLWMIVQRSLS